MLVVGFVVFSGVWVVSVGIYILYVCYIVVMVLGINFGVVILVCLGMLDKFVEKFLVWDVEFMVCK